MVCPECGAVNSLDASACACGYIINAATGSYEAAELTLQEEEAYLEYIEARLAQLEYDKGFAESDVEHNPGNREKEQTLENIRGEISQLHQQYNEQTAKIKATKKVNAELRVTMEKEQAAARAKAEAEAARMRKEKEKAEAMMRARKEAERKKKEAAEKARQDAEIQKKAAEEKARQEAQRKIQEALAKKEAEAAAKMKAEEAEREEKARMEARRKIEEALAKKEAEAAQQAALDAERLEREQLVEQKKTEAARLLAEAERIKRENAEVLAAAAAIKQRANVSRPEPELDADRDLAEAADAVEQPAFQECPVCTAELPLGATSCKCGYTFQTSASDMPSLSTGDFFAAAPVDDNTEMQECPICTAEVPATARQCKCGYQFAGAEDSTMPGLSLDGDLD